MVLYADDESITQALELVAWEQLDYKFYSELFYHIDETEFWQMAELLQSERMKRYSMAIEKAALACTNDLAQLIELALVDKETKH